MKSFQAMLLFKLDNNKIEWLLLWMMCQERRYSNKNKLMMMAPSDMMTTRINTYLEC